MVELTVGQLIGVCHNYGVSLGFDEATAVVNDLNAIITAKETEDALPIQVSARCKRKRIAKNQLGKWGGFVGKRKVKDFGLSEETALQWLWGHDASTEQK